MRKKVISCSHSLLQHSKHEPTVQLASQPPWPTQTPTSDSYIGITSLISSTNTTPLNLCSGICLYVTDISKMSHHGSSGWFNQTVKKLKGRRKKKLNRTPFDLLHEHSANQESLFPMVVNLQTLKELFPNPYISIKLCHQAPTQK